MNRRFSPILVVIAALNEEEGVGPTLLELRRVLDNPHMVVVDGNSVDKTVEVAKKLGADVLLQEGKGKGDAIFQGIRQLSPDVQFVVFTDADYTYPAEYIPKMMGILEQNQSVGMVIGNRFNGEHNFDESIPDPFYLGNRFLAFAQQVFNGVKLNDPLTGLRAVRASILRNWKPRSKSFDVEAEMNFLVERAGHQIVEIPIRYRHRLGEKKLKLRHGFVILKRIMSESLSM